jgi:hypothetical protein
MVENGERDEERRNRDAEADDDEPDHHEQHEADQLEEQHRDEHESHQSELRQTQQTGEEQRPQRVEAARIGHGQRSERQEDLAGEVREEWDQPAQHGEAQLDSGDPGQRPQRGLSNAGAPMGPLVVADPYNSGHRGRTDDDHRHQCQCRVRVVVQAGGVELDVAGDHRPSEAVGGGGVVAVG